MRRSLHPKIVGFCFGLLAVSFASCNCGGRASPTAAYDQWCQSLTATYCDGLITCSLLESAARPDCIAAYGRFNCDASRPSLAKGYRTFDSNLAAECLQAVQAAMPGCDPGSMNALACRQALGMPGSGTGQPCAVDADCSVEGDLCAGNTCPETCQPGGGLGQPCRNPLCLTGLRCPYSCNPGLWCDPTNETCRAPQGPGSACHGSFTNECDATTYCSATSLCEPAPGAAQACNSGYPNCTAGTYCELSSSPRTCQTRSAVGQACNYSDNCVDAAYCDRSVSPAVCAAKKASGVACQLIECAADLACNNGICSPLRGADGACTKDGDCQLPLLCDYLLKTCQPYTNVWDAGAPCTGSASLCACPDCLCKGQRWSPDGGAGTMGTCAPRAVGDGCFDNSACPKGAYCAAGACAPAGPDTPCSGSDSCQAGFFCGAGQKCHARVDPGQPCEVEETNPCTPPNVCRPAGPDAGLGICAEPGGAGDGCGRRAGFLGTACKMFYECIDFTCVATGRLNQPCTRRGECSNSVCSGADGGDPGICLPLRVDGAPCSWPFNPCVNLCDNGTCRTPCP